MKFKEIATNIKIWIGAGVAIVGVLAAWGMQFDHPVFASELEPLRQIAGMNQKAIKRMETDQVTRSIWKQEDRLKVSPNPDGEQRLRELKEHLERLKEEMRRLLEEEKKG